MKKIAYFLSHDITKNDGVTKKINSQVDVWKDKGFIVKVFCIVPRISSSLLNCEKYETLGGVKDRLFVRDDIYGDIDLFKPDVVYYRNGMRNSTLKKLSKKYCVVTELNTLDLIEAKLSIFNNRTFVSILRYLALFILRRGNLKCSTGLVGVTKEISNHPSYIKYCTNTTYSTNSLDLKKYPTLKENNNIKKINFFFMGTPNQPWHGVDFIENWARQLPQYHFHLVGIDGINTKNIFYYGYLNQAQYLDVLSSCDICIGSLAMFRNKLTEASPLKVREYLAYGYPTIIGYNDTAFIENGSPNWLFKYDETTSLKELCEFVNLNKNVIVKHSELESISSFYVETKRVEFMNDCYSRFSS